jgi:acylphosphatase
MPENGATNPQMSKIDNKRLHAIVSGRVQGVGFRYFTQRQAVSHDLTGWVRNRWDGTVEIIAEGPVETVTKLLNVVQRGPHAGTTQNVKHLWQEPTGEFNNFRVRRTV